jgi:class 3 adenylate cyclase/predicted ATPase
MGRAIAVSGTLFCCGDPKTRPRPTLVPAMQQIADWLKKLGMSEYAERFAENDIDMAVLPDLTDQHLKDLGVSLGHRLKMLRAIRDLSGAPAAVTAPSAPVATQPTQRDEAERRQLTVMFCDLVGSTALSARLDPEDLRSIIGAYHRCCTDWIERNGGFVAKYMGDGVLAYFGYPQAHEHDAERAVRAALYLVEAVPKLATNAGSPLQVRVGIATGLVVVGDLIGAGAAQEQAVVGETPNLAARLQALAEPGAVVIASSTRKVTGGLFEYCDLGTVALKGFAENVPAWQVLGASAAESRFEALRATTTPLIGRDEEIDLLMRRWSETKARNGCVVLISGEPGIGKSRIAQSALERLSGEPHTRLRYFCSPHHQDSALYPSVRQLERAAGFRREDTSEQRLAKLEAVLSQATSDLSEAVPLFAELLSIPTSDRYRPLDVTPQKRKEKTLHAQLAQVEGLASRQPVLMVFEDIQWSDPTTRESLELLIDRVPTMPVMVILTFRPEFVAPWVDRPHVTLLSLTRLPPQHQGEMIAHITGGKALPREITDQIIDRTDGVPLFIEELIKSVVESGVVTETDNGYALAGPVTPLTIPTTLHASLLARLDRLAPTREVAQIGAALGRQFSHELISAVAQMPQNRVDDALAQLVGAELIFRRGTPPDAQYTFKHALVQDAAYSTLLRSRRQQLHGRIVTTLESQFSEIVASEPQVMAQHCAEAGLTEKAVVYWLGAGQRALARAAMAEAISQLRKGLDLLANLPDTPTRRRHELDLQIALGQAVIGTQGYATPVVGEVFARARQLYEQLDRPPQFVGVLYGQFLNNLVRGELLQAQVRAQEMLQLGEARNDDVLRMVSLVCLGYNCFWLGEFERALAYQGKSLALYDPERRPAYTALTPDDPHTTAQIYFSITLLSLGYPDQARIKRDESLAEARAHAHTLGFVLAHSCVGEWGIQSEILSRAEEAVALAADRGFPVWLASGTMFRGWSLAAQGRQAEGIALLHQGLTVWRGMGAMMDLPMYLMLLADAYGNARQPEEGLKHLDEATRIMEATQGRVVEAEMLRIRAKLLTVAGNRAAAEESLRTALSVARSQCAKLWELRAGTSLARLLKIQGNSIEARNLLAPIYGWYAEGFDTPDLKDAKALLDQLV